MSVNHDSFTQTAPPGAVKAFVDQHANIDAGSVEEAKRLLPLAHEQGLQTATVNSLKSAIMRARMQRAGKPLRGARRVQTGKRYANLPAPKPGTMQAWVHAHADVSKPPHEEAKRLYDLFTAEGRTCTIGSMTQALYVERWRQGIRTTTVTTVRRRHGQAKAIAYAAQPPRPATEAILGMIDNALKGFATLRHAVKAIESDAKAYQRLKQQLKGLSS